MKFRYTNNELINTTSKEYLNDFQLIISLITERQSNCTNTYAPLYKRLEKLRNKAEKRWLEFKETEL